MVPLRSDTETAQDTKGHQVGAGSDSGPDAGADPSWVSGACDSAVARRPFLFASARRLSL